MRISGPAIDQIQNPLPKAVPVVVPDSAGTPHKNRFATNRMAGSNPVWKPRSEHLQTSFAPQNAAAGSNPTASGVPADKQLGFADFLDVINPLQHIPVVSTFYRKATGDNISAPAQFMGGALFGGPLGAAAAMVDVAVRDRTGKGFSENVAALAFDRDNAFKQKTPVFELATNEATATALDGVAPAAGERVYDFGLQPRTAGLMPVWKDNPAQLAATLSPDTNFALMLESLDVPTPHIS